MSLLPFASVTNHLNSSAVRDILKLTQGKEILSLAGGLPAESMFPIEAVRDAYDRVFRSDRAVLQYGLTEGFTPLREDISLRMARKNVQCTVDDLLLTTGSQQSIDLFCKIWLDAGDTVLVESPTYLAALQVMQTYRADIRSVRSDEFGMLPDDLEHQLRTRKPKLVYVIPTFSNPSGRVWSNERREQLVRLCKQYGVLILEDDPYGDIQFDRSKRFPLLAEIDQQLGGERNVVYTSTFSKTVAPALRTGWVTGRREVVQMMAKAKQAADLHSSTIDQRALHELLNGFDLDQHILAISVEYGKRMRSLISLLNEQKWDGVRWNEPQGGMFMWMELPEQISSADLMKHAVEEGVAFVPGEVFFAENPQRNTMRINFTHTEPSLMPTAVERLNRALIRMYARA